MDAFCPTDSVTRTIEVPSKERRPDAWRKAKEIAKKHGANVGVGSVPQSARLRINAKFRMHSWHASNEASAAFVREWQEWALSNGMKVMESIGAHYWVSVDPA